jgi:hypothetical protein
MVDKIARSIYIQSLIVSILIFLSGIMTGIWIDNYRVSMVRKELLESSVYWDDSLFLTKYMDFFGKNSCELSLDFLLLFNEKIYKRGKEIEKIIRQNVFSPEMIEEWKKYTLLQANFWMNSVELKRKCNFTYHTVVHLQQFFAKNPSEISENRAQSTIMLNLKEMCGNRIMLIPLTVDLNLTSVDIVLSYYNITKLPAVIIDEKYIFQGLTPLEKLKELCGC